MNTKLTHQLRYENAAEGADWSQAEKQIKEAVVKGDKAKSTVVSVKTKGEKRKAAVVETAADIFEKEMGTAGRGGKKHKKGKK